MDVKINLYDIQKTTFKIGDFISWHKDGTLKVDPDFQRRSVWNENSKSYLLDTIVRGLPIPIIILREKVPSFDDYKRIREVVDGQQRLTTIFEFFNKGFPIKKMHNTEFAGLKFDKLPDYIKQRILDYEISVHVLPSSISDAQVLEIFSRLNSTGYKLNKQELRNAEFQGEFKATVYEVSNKFIDLFLQWNLFSKQQITRMEEVECTSDLFVYMIDEKISAKKPEVIDKKYSDYEDIFPEADKFKERYIFTLNTIHELIGSKIKHSIFSRYVWFYQLFVLIYKRTYIDAKSVPNEWLDKLLKFSEMIENDEGIPVDIIKHTTRGTNNIDSRRIVNVYFANLIVGER